MSMTGESFRTGSDKAFLSPLAMDSPSFVLFPDIGAPAVKIRCIGYLFWRHRRLFSARTAPHPHRFCLHCPSIVSVKSTSNEGPIAQVVCTSHTSYAGQASLAVEHGSPRSPHSVQRSSVVDEPLCNCRTARQSSLQNKETSPTTVEFSTGLFCLKA